MHGYKEFKGKRFSCDRNPNQLYACFDEAHTYHLLCTDHISPNPKKSAWWVDRWMGPSKKNMCQQPNRHTQHLASTSSISSHAKGLLLMQAAMQCKSGGLEYLFTPFLKQANPAICLPLPFMSSPSISVLERERESNGCVRVSSSSLKKSWPDLCVAMPNRGCV